MPHTSNIPDDMDKRVFAKVFTYREGGDEIGFAIDKGDVKHIGGGNGRYGVVVKMDVAEALRDWLTYVLDSHKEGPGGSL